MKLLHQITLDWIPTDLNTYIDAERSNRFIASKIKSRETESVWAKAISLPKILEPRVHIRFEYYTKNEKKDPDNISFTKKYVLDGFVKAGLLKNDGRKQIGSFSDGFYLSKSDNEYIIIKIYDTDPYNQW